MTVQLEVRLISGDVLAALDAKPEWTAADIKAFLRVVEPKKRISELIIVNPEFEGKEFPFVGAEVLVFSCMRWTIGKVVEINSDGDKGRIDALVDGKLEKSIGTTRYRKPEAKQLAGTQTVEEGGLADGQSFLQAVFAPYSGTISLNEFDSIKFSEDGTYVRSSFEFAGSSMCGGSTHTSEGTWQLDEQTGELITDSGTRFDSDRLR